jgi:hypothetical protein
MCFALPSPRSYKKLANAAFTGRSFITASKFRKKNLRSASNDEVSHRGTRSALLTRPY